MSVEGAEGASHSVYRGILRALEDGSLVPGQRLIESELAAQFGVGRNAVREAMQRLAARGVVDLSRNRSASIRQIDIEEAQEVYAVSGPMVELLFSLAAEKYDAERDEPQLREAMAALEAAYANGQEYVFSRARRQLYRCILRIADNRELTRIFPAIGTHIINAKYQSHRLQGVRIHAYGEIVKAVMKRDIVGAARLGRDHNAEMCAAVCELDAQKSVGRAARA